MNEMEKYLEEHNYISKNKNKDPLRQQELSKQRAECISNKYNNLVEGKDKEIERLNNIINELEKYLKEKQTLCGVNQQGFSWGVCGDALDKLQELKEGK